MNSVVSPPSFVSRKDEACNLLANLAFSISGKMPVASPCDLSRLVPYLVNASASWAKTFVGLAIPIPKRFTNFQFVKSASGQLILTEQTLVWTLSIMENSIEAMDFVGNRTSKRGTEEPVCTSENGSESYLLPGDRLNAGSLKTEITKGGDLIVNDLIVSCATGDRQAASAARYTATRSASRLVDQMISGSKLNGNFADQQHRIYSTYVQLEIIKQYCASLWLLKDAQSLTFAQSALESALSCLEQQSSTS
ncbi:MAG: hypothetical protein JST89_24240 [Cyanobacteria bacterium SZAS-4]|nr:hypothetical protein [Cyanobacteria bacterium SZAS-4]